MIVFSAQWCLTVVRTVHFHHGPLIAAVSYNDNVKFKN